MGNRLQDIVLVNVEETNSWRTYPVDLSKVAQPMDGDFTGKNFLCMEQLTSADINVYLTEADAAYQVYMDPSQRGINLLPFVVLTSVMRQESTRTGGSMTTAIEKLGGVGHLISGMKSSSEAKGESIPDSWVAFATQSDLIGTRTPEEWGPALAASAIHEAIDNQTLARHVPVINLGDGENQHPTQTIGDLLTIKKHYSGLDGLTIAIVGDHERYRAHHSLALGAAAMGMKIIAVESAVARMPQSLVDEVSASLVVRTEDLDSAMADADVLYMGRKPDEYKRKGKEEEERNRKLEKAYAGWTVDRARLQKMRPGTIVMHPRPRRNELHPDVDSDPRMRDVQQMELMIPARMAIIALHSGKSIIEAVQRS